MRAIVAALAALLLLLADAVAAARVSKYNVAWSDLLPEANSTYVNVMPVGNGDVTLNVWPDRVAGAVGLMIAKGDAFSEAAELLKVGLVTVQFTPNPFSTGSYFNMTLDLSTATILLHIGGTDIASSLSLQVYVDANQNTAVLTSSASYTHSLTATATLVRPQPTTATPPFDCQAYTTSADQYGDAAVPASVVLFHRNSDGQSYVRNTLTAENFPEALPFVHDPLTFATFGAAVFGDAGVFQRRSQSVLAARAPQQQFTLGVAVHTQQTPTVAEWAQAIAALAARGVPPKAAHDAWWAGFWERSWVDVTTPAAFRVAQQYAIQRYLQALQARVPYPIKFNGMLFTANRPPNADARDWGGSNWWQNLRLPYYNMLATGDTDMLATLFASFTKNLVLAQNRTQLYYNFSGVFWPEYTSVIGTTHPNSYGCGRAGKSDPPKWYSEDQWNHYNWQGGLDLSLLILDHYAFTGDAATLRTHMPMVQGIIEFYRQHWTALDDNGKVVLYPTQAIETWQCPGYPPNPNNCATNDAPSIAGLWAVLPRLLALPAELFPADRRPAWTAFLNRLPPLPQGGSGNSSVLLPCEKCPAGTSNVENAELYPVHPYRLYTADKPDLQRARNTYAKRRFTSDEGWNQNAMDAALLGMAAEAQRLVTARAAMAPAPGYRFQGFMPHLQDYEPSADHLAVMNNALTYMLLQPLDDAQQGMSLLPAWPCAWDVEFRLNGPANTVVEGALQGGKLTYTVQPPARAAAVKVHACQ